MNGRIGQLWAAAGVATMVAGAAWGQGTSLDQSRAYSSELLADASGRTSSLAPAEQDFSVNVHGFIQFRYNWNQREDSALEDDATIGFQNARTKINLSGNIANENWGYYIQFKMDDPGGGAATLDDVYGTYNMGNGWKVQFGQFKLNLFREENMSDTTQLFANRSVLNSVFSQRRSQGIQFSHEGDQFQFFGAFSDGLNTANTDFNSPAEADWALTARGNFKWAGDWKQGKDFTSFRNSDFFGLVGGAVHYQQGGDTFPTTDMNVLAATVDLQIEGNGWNAFGAICYTNTDPAAGDSFSDFGFLIQGGVFVSNDWELVAGWDMLIPDDDRGSADDNFSTIRIGANHYFIPESHAVKLTIDFSWFLDAQADSIAPQNTLTGLLFSDEDTQWNLRGQIQLVF